MSVDALVVMIFVSQMLYTNSVIATQRIALTKSNTLKRWTYATRNMLVFPH